MSIEFQHLTFPLQTLPTGETTIIHAYQFKGGDGPSIYIQANLHGPEIIGTPLSGMLIRYLQSLEQLNGTVTIVPCANPLGVNESSTALDGRWNKKSGYNWNRIFLVDKQWRSAQEKDLYYQTMLQTPNLSIEDKLAATLHTIAGTPNYVIDLHCCGIETCHYLFSFPGHIEHFAECDTRVVINVDEDGFANSSFMGSFYSPFMEYGDDAPKVCTWEVGGDQQIDRGILDQRWLQLKRWIDAKLRIQEAEVSYIPSNQVVSTLNNFVYIHSHQSGYFIWEREVGEIIEPGEAYITYFNPATAEFTAYSEDRRFLFISKYTIAAVGEGEQIGELIWL